MVGSLLDEEVDISLDEGLRQDILTSRRRFPLKNISIKMDPFVMQMVRKVATQKGMPYQVLIRSWITQKIKNELDAEDAGTEFTKKTVHVMPHKNGKWHVKKGGGTRASKIATTRKDAVKIARQMAKRDKAELVIHKPDGKLRSSESYGNNP